MTITTRHFKFKILILIFTICTFVSAVELPSAEQINHLAEFAELTTEVFFQQSFELRMGYEFSGDFLTEADRNSLREICQRAVKDLNTLAGQQQQLKKQIEEYQGPDWEQRYGETGLWRKLSADLYKTQLALCEIDYYRALTAEAEQQKQITAAALANLTQLEQQFSCDDLELLKAKLQQDKACQLSRTVIFAEKQNFKGKNQAFLTVAFLYYRLGNYQEFEELLNRHRQLAPVAGQVILSQLTKGKQPACRFEAELAALAALQKEPVNQYADILIPLAETKSFESPLILYAAGLSLAKTSPKMACEFLVGASQLQQEQKNTYLDIDGPAIAEQAGRLAYNLYVADPNNCYFAVETLRNYQQISSDKMADDLEYLYSQLLYECYDALKGQYLLKRIAKADGKYGKKAILQLTAEKIRIEAYQDPNQRQVLLRQFADSLEDADDCGYSTEALGLLKDILVEIETVEDDPKTLAAMLRNSYKIANFFRGCPNSNLIDLVWAELNILKADANETSLGRAEEIIEQLISSCDSNDYDLLRCRGRLLQKKERFCEAAKLWQKLAGLEKKVPDPFFSWWRAKYYELYCWGNCENVEIKDVLHAIEVLEASFDEIPAPWAKKLLLLKQQKKGS